MPIWTDCGRLAVPGQGHNTHGGIDERPQVSFRSRLLLFFMIIVIVPMVAVALVLFSITADSETGKADAQIAQGLRAAFAIYDGERSKARPKAQQVAGDPVLAAALTKGDRAGVKRAIATVDGARAISVYDADRTL